MSSMLPVLDAWRRRRSIAAEAFRATLAGLPGVHVHVEPLNDDAERDGLRQAALSVTAEATLRQAGVPVFSQSELVAGVPGMPVLEIDVMTIRLDAQYAYSVRVELWQAARLERAPEVVTLALTWAAPQLVGTIAADRLVELRDSVRSAVAHFVEEWRLAGQGRST